jgi:two-component system sensor histidine kinase BaeS
LLVPLYIGWLCHDCVEVSTFCARLPLILAATQLYWFMVLSLQKKFFFAFFAIAAVLVLMITSAQHKVLRDGFDDYVAHVKVQRLSSVEEAVVAYALEHKGLSGLAAEGEWMRLVAEVNADSRERRDAQRTAQNDKARTAPSKTVVIGPVSADGTVGPTVFPNYSASRPVKDYGGEYLNKFTPRRELPASQKGQASSLRGVALLDASGVLLVGEVIPVNDALRAPIVDGNGELIGQWLIRKGAPELDGLGRQFLEEQLESMFWMLAAAAIASAIFAWLLAEYFRQPVRRLKDAFRRVETGQLDTRLPARGNDEITEIEEHFNSMTRHLGAQEIARKQWMADTSHELRTPLTILRTRMEAMRDGMIPNDDTEWDRNLKVVTDFSVLVNDLQAMARADAGQWDLQNAALDVQTWLANAFRDNKASFDAAGLDLILQTPTEDMSIWGDEQRLQQVLRNVLVNSQRYTDAPGRVVLAAERSEDSVRVIVEDSAPSVPADALPHLFERFYRVDGSRNRGTGGSGLGLAICESIVKVHRGSIKAEHSDIGGLRVTIELPLWQPNKPAKSPTALAKVLTKK